MIVCVLWAHLPLLVAFGVATGHSLVHSVLDLGPVIPFAVAASTSMLPRRARSAMAALGLLTSLGDPRPPLGRRASRRTSTSS